MAKSKAKVEEEVKAVEEVKTVEEKAKEPKKEPKAEEPKKNDKVQIMVPYVEGEDPEVTVIINGHITKFRKGVTVEVPRNVARVLERSNKNLMTALENQKKFKKQVTDL